MPSTTTTNLDAIATRVRRSVTSNTSFDSASLDGHSLFSSDDMSVAKRPTVTSSRENGSVLGGEMKKRPAMPKGNRNNSLDGQKGTMANGTEGKSIKRLPTDARVVPVASASSPSNKPGVRTPTNPSSHKQSHSPTKPPSPSRTQGMRDPEQSIPKNRSKTLPKSQPSIMMSMSALIEQNEDAILHYSMPKSNVLVNRSRSNSTPKDSTTHVSSPSQPRRKSNPTRSDLVRRRSRSLENLDRGVLPSESSTPEPSTLSSSIPSSRPAPPHSRRTSSSRTSSQGKAGYTSSPLSRTTLSQTPRSPMSPDAFAELSVGFGPDGQLYLTKNGSSQNTMTTVELTREFSRNYSNATINEGDVKGKARAVELPFSIMNTRRPPSYVPEGSVLVQVWAVGLDIVDARLCGGAGTTTTEPRDRTELGFGKRSATDTKSLPGRPGGLIRTLSLSRRKTKEEIPGTPPTGAKSGSAGSKQPELGYTPGRSFVGRVVEVGDMDDNREMGFRKGDWVVGLLELRKSGALQEYIVVDRRRILRIPPPSLTDLSMNSSNIPTPTPSPSRSRSKATSAASAPIKTADPPRLTIDELALLPLCGVQAYRATRTLKVDNNANAKARRILVLNGHDGVGALATQMLAKRGWKVVVHAPCPEDKDLVIQIKSWGGDAVIFDGGEGPVKMMERLLQEEDSNSAIDAILDTVGGKDVWEAGEKLLKAQGQSLGGSFLPPSSSVPVQAPTLQSSSSLSRRFGSIRRRNTSSSTGSIAISTGGSNGGSGSGKQLKQFITTIGDFPDRPIPSASDHFKSGLRSMRKSGVDYTWVNLAQDIDFEGGDVREALKRAVRMALEEGIRPALSHGHSLGTGRVVGLERTPEVFGCGGETQKELESGSTVVVRVVE